VIPLRILIIEDDALLRKAVYDRVSKWGHKAHACESLAEARDFQEKSVFDLVLTDMCLPDGNAVDFLEEEKKANPETEIVVMTAFADVRTAISAIRSGAYDYLPKPFEDEQLEKVIRNVAEKCSLSKQVSMLGQLAEPDLDDFQQFGDMIGTASLGRIFETARRIAKTPDTTVLILGESGTGKGMLAKAIHRFSPRGDKPFVDINCSAIPAQLMESEMFGYEKGAFTDAKTRKPGLLEAAQGGTVFLDEIGDMEMNLQGKLLKVLEDKEFRRLGGSRSTRVDVRVIAATNRDLKAKVKEGQFREDLYYRLSVVPIVMPPLREHKESVDILAKCYLGLFCRQMGRQIEGFSPEAIKSLREYSWPGNVRELRNVVERCVILGDGNVISEKELNLSGAVPTPSTPSSTGEAMPVMSLAECERKLIESVLKSVDGNKNKAADILKIHRTTLYKKIEEYGLEAG
jgi:DNA-binding NtrC family response regulator